MLRLRIAAMEFSNYFGWACHPSYMRIKQRLVDLNMLDDLDLFIREVIAPELFTHMICLDMHIQYDDALTILYESQAWDYGNILTEADQLLVLLGGTAATDVASRDRARRTASRRRM